MSVLITLCDFRLYFIFINLKYGNWELVLSGVEVWGIGKRTRGRGDAEKFFPSLPHLPVGERSRTTSSQSPVPSPQSPVPSPQSPVPSPQSPVPSPQSPVP
ncbi:MAG: hypothetical protein KME21_08770 [Desmonostoc vinosum HA7617-LM4]|nr:hypothetical protein [Desmonostoc vinosum HA7617-LM4]